jgi:hypothetical protein
MMDLSKVATPVMAVQVPTQGVFTLYPIIGDLVAWLSVAGLVGLAVWVIVARRRAASSRPAA